MKKIIALTISFLFLGCFQLHAQDPTTISGTVTDAESGETLPGVTILEKETVNGTTTNLDGEYTITLQNPDNPLIFSYVGFEPQEVPTDSEVIDIELIPSRETLDEVVIVGYSEQRKESVVGSIATTTSADLQKMGTPNLSNALAGRVSGVVTMTGSGRPGGDDAEIFIRGISTLREGDSTPLILVDGVERDISRVHPDDIESFSVLKDASATAVYGVRGANGVVLIETKRGRTDTPPEISLRYNTTMQEPTRLPNFLGSYDHARLRNEALVNDGAPPRYSEEDLEKYQTQSSPYTHPDNDYMDDFLRDITPMHNLNVNVRGGTEDLTYFVGANATFQDGLYKQFEGAKYPTNAHYKHLNLRSNLDYQITNTTTMSVDLNTRLQREQNTSPGGIGSTAIFSNMYRTPPNYYAYELPDGRYGTNPDDIQVVNLMALLKDYGRNRMNDNILEGTIRGRQQLDFVTQGLEVRGMASFNSYYQSGTKVGYWPELWGYTPPEYEEDDAGNLIEVEPEEYELLREETPPWTSSLGNQHRRRNQYEISLRWAREFDEHDLTGMMLYTQTQGYTNHNMPKAFMGYVGRATYSYMDRYLAEINFGYNGSDQFEEDNRFGFFPSFSAGWIMSQENFMRNNVPLISYLKIRGSYGLVGNDKIGTDRFLFLQTFNQGSPYYFGTDDNFGPVTTLFEGGMGNENVTWEIGKKANLGLDFMMFNDRLSFEVDLFQENREQIFIQRESTPVILGVDLPQENIGKVRNQGYEIEAMYRDDVGNLGFFLGGMMSYSKNKVVYTDELPPEHDYMAREGKPVGQNFGLEVLGYYNPNHFVSDDDGNLITDDGGNYQLIDDMPEPSWNPVQPGDFIYRDRNGDGVINTFDEGPIGNSRIPRYIFSFQTGLNYKGWDFSMMWQGAAGHHKFITGPGAWEPVRDRDRFMEDHLYRWTEERWENGEEIRYPRLSSVQNQHNHRNNTFYQEKGDYLRLKNIELGYSIPPSYLEQMSITSLRVYATGTNLLTLAYIDQFDPEVGSSSGISYPQLKLWSLGVNMRF